MRYTPAERRVIIWLYNRGFRVETTRHKCPYDALCDGQRIEIKCSNLNEKEGRNAKRWVFNIQRHGIVDERFVDFYVLRLDGLPKEIFGNAAIHLVLRAPVKKSSIQISPRTLLTHWGKHFNKIELIKEAGSKSIIQHSFPASDKDARLLRNTAMTISELDSPSMSIS